MTSTCLRAGCLIAVLVTASPCAGQTASPPAPGRATARPVEGIATLLADGERALAAGELDRARQIAETCASRAPADVRGHLLLGRVHAAAGRWADAYPPLRQASALAPRHPDVLYHLGLVTGELAQAEFARVFTLDPRSARVHQLLAESLEAQERRAEAEAEYDLALQARPDLLDALLALARLKRIRLDCDGAIALYTRAEGVRPTYDAAYGLGMCHLHRQEDEAALARMREAVARDPRAALAWVGLGSAELRAGRAAEAVAHLQKAIALEPRLGEAHYLLGRAYQRAGDTARAQDAFAAAERLRSGATPEGPR